MCCASRCTTQHILFVHNKWTCSLACAFCMCSIFTALHKSLVRGTHLICQPAVTCNDSSNFLLCIVTCVRLTTPTHYAPISSHPHYTPLTSHPHYTPLTSHTHYTPLTSHTHNTPLTSHPHSSQDTHAGYILAVDQPVL